MASPRGANLFVGFGCDEVEFACFNDAFMLDTTNLNGMRWLRLPIGLARPTPRHMAAAWVRSNSLVISGGCTPAKANLAKVDKCYSDVWGTPLPPHPVPFLLPCLKEESATAAAYPTPVRARQS